MFTARKGQEGLRCAKEYQPRTIFLDISMPHMDGTETLKLIRDNDDPDIRIIVVSGYASASLARELSQQGAYDFFQKPVDLMQLREAVEHIRNMQDMT